MSLTLKILKTPPNIDMELMDIPLEKGGSIGRGVSNTVVLNDPDRYLSSAHALITRNENTGEYILTDTSTNGVFVNGSKKALGKTNQTSIKSGDILKMGHYEIKVIIGIPTFIKDGTQISSKKSSSPLHQEIDDLINGVNQPPMSQGLNDPAPHVSVDEPQKNNGFGSPGINEVLGGGDDLDPLIAIEKMNQGGSGILDNSNSGDGVLDLNDSSPWEASPEPPPIQHAYQPPSV